MSTIAITKVGSKAHIIIDSGVLEYYVNLENVNMWYNTTDTDNIGLSFSMGPNDYFYPANPIASVTIGGVLITDQTVFNTQIAAVFLSAGASALPTGGTV